MSRRPSSLVQLSPRGQLTLPIRVRKALGLQPGDELVISVDEGRAILEPAVVVPVEHYSEGRIREFQKASRLTREETRKVRRKWRI
jgi:AbrB family looped-hinge helix DNA binding protein